MKKILMLALALTVTTIAYTQRPKHHQPNPELKKEMQSYIEKNVAPVLQKAQNEFDEKLSAEDLEFIQAKRSEAAVIRAERKKEHHAKMEKRKAERPQTEEERKARKEKFEKMTEAEQEVFRKERMEKRKAKHAEMKESHGASKKEVKAFMERNKELITSTMTDLKPNYEKWIADQKEIFEKHKPEDAPKMKEGKRKGHVGLFGLQPPRGKRHQKGMRGKSGERKMKGEKGEKGERGEKGKEGKKAKKRNHKKGGKVAVEFVLWDGTIPTPPVEIRDELGGNVTPNTNAKVLLGQNFPNPAKGITRVEIEIPEGVNQLILTITDMNGKVAQRLNLTNLSAGKETIDLDVNSLANGQYFYTIEYNGWKESKKMTVSH